MCGITGFVNKKRNKKEVLTKMMNRIIHRGPDGSGMHIDKNVALGHRRLSIIDLDYGSQPIYNEDSSCVIVFNGEIYNYKKLQKVLKKDGHIFTSDSDTEVILHGYEKWGKDVVKRLRGMFAFAIWDKKNNELFLARDGFGIKQIYYYLNNDTLMFSSEIKSFLDHPDFKKELNEDIISAYLCFNSVPTNETLFNNVKRLEPGHTLSYKDNIVTIERFFKLEFNENGLENSVDNIQSALKNSVRHHLISDVPVGAFLSSGVDSSLLVALALPKNTYTVGYYDTRYNEISFAKELSSKLNLNNHSKIIDSNEYLEVFPKIMYHMDEPVADPATAAIYFLAQKASKDVKVVISGEGADEFFGGYNKYQEEFSCSTYMKIPYCIRKPLSVIASAFPDVKGFNFIYRRGQNLEDYNIGIGRIFRDKEAMNILKVKNQVHTRDIVKPFYEEYKDNSTLVQRQVIDYYFWLVRDFLHIVDRNTMMFGLEARTPFLDTKVYEVARKLSKESKVNAVETKVDLRLAAKEVIPNDSYKKKKLGFPVPLREWIKEDLYYDTILRAFKSEVATKYFNTKKIIKYLDDHKNNKKDNYKKIWTIYTFIVWYNQFFVEEH